MNVGTLCRQACFPDAAAAGYADFVIGDCPAEYHTYQSTETMGNLEIDVYSSDNSATASM